MNVANEDGARDFKAIPSSTILIDLCALKLEIFKKLSYLDGSFKSIKERDRLHKYSAGKKKS